MDDKRVVSKERGEAIAREHNIKFLETSAKTNINIETAFIQLAEAILDKSNVQETKPTPFPQPVQNSGPSCPGCGR